MKEKILLILLVGTLGIASLGATTNATTSEDYIPSETTTIVPVDPLIQRVQTRDKEKLKQLIKECKERKASAHAMAEAARELGYAETDTIILVAIAEWNAADSNLKYYQQVLNEVIAEEEEAAREAAEAAEKAKWDKKRAEYPVATQVWLLLKSYGLNDYVCAGIIGNMMAETGGQTLALNAYAGGRYYYGLCQWNQAYFSQVYGADVEGQIAVLMNTIKTEFDTYGFVYQSGFDYDDFCQLSNEQSAAKAFAACYERCGSGSYTVRKTNATKALEYFTK